MSFRKKLPNTISRTYILSINFFILNYVKYLDMIKRIKSYRYFILDFFESSRRYEQKYLIKAKLKWYRNSEYIHNEQSSMKGAAMLAQKYLES